MYSIKYYSTNKDHLEECDKVENVAVTGAALFAIRKEITQEISKMTLNVL